MAINISKIPQITLFQRPQITSVSRAATEQTLVPSQVQPPEHERSPVHEAMDTREGPVAATDGQLPTNNKTVATGIDAREQVN